MAAMEEQILRTAKEIVVKFIETGRVSPVGFPEAFKGIYGAVRETVLGAVVEPRELPEVDPNAPKKRKKS